MAEEKNIEHLKGRYLILVALIGLFGTLISVAKECNKSESPKQEYQEFQQAASVAEDKAIPQKNENSRNQKQTFPKKVEPVQSTPNSFSNTSSPAQPRTNSEIKNNQKLRSHPKIYYLIKFKIIINQTIFFMKAFFSALPLIALLSLSTGIKPTTTDVQCGPCGEDADKLEYADLPRFDQGDWYSAYDVYYGSHKTCVISFSDGYNGKIFLGGSSGKFFVGGADGGKYYYIDQKETIRALYIYKKYNCISKRYRN